MLLTPMDEFVLLAAVIRQMSFLISKSVRTV